MKGQRNLSDSCPDDFPPAVAGYRLEVRRSSRGVALVVTLLLLFLMSVLGLAAVLTSSSDLLINGYYANYRASFYAADSGMNIARQAMYTQLLAAFPTTFTEPPLSNPTGTATTILSNINSTYGSSSSPYTLNAGGSANSLKESFYVKNTSFSLGTGPTAVYTGTTLTGYTYQYNYGITSVGRATGTEQATITENGAFMVTVSASGTVPGNFAFSAFGAFINNFPACNGPLVYGTLTGPMYAKGQWNLGSGGSYTFTDPVNQTGSDFSYWVGNSCNNSASVPYTSGRTTINPNFEGGYNLNQAAAALPANDYSQRWAVLDGKGCGEGGSTCGSITNLPPEPTQANLNAVLKNISQTAYPDPTPTSTAPGTTTGVYLPYTCSGSTCSLNSNAGGIYVEANGNSSGITTNVTLSTTNGSGGSSNPSGQVIQVAQTAGSTTSHGSVTQTSSTSCSKNWAGQYTCSASYQQVSTTSTPTTVTNITVDPVAGTTTVASYVQTSTGTTTATTTATCTGSSSCTPTAPSSISGGSTTTTTSNGATTTLNLTGVPENLNTTPASPATMIYVDGDVNISGPSSGAAIQNNSMVTLTANGNIQQTGNLLYATEPVTTSANQVVNSSCCNGDPVDTLIPSVENMNQVLGMFTATGQFQLNPSSSGANLETDASVAAIASTQVSCGSGCTSGMIATPGNSVGTWTNIGGRVESSINGVSINTGNVYYDRRFTARSNFAPPWFPQTTIAAGDIVGGNGAQTIITPQRVQWVSTSGGQ